MEGWEKWKFLEEVDDAHCGQTWVNYILKVINYNYFSSNIIKLQLL